MSARQRRADVILRAQRRKYKQDLREAKRDTRRFAKDTKATLISGFKGGFGAVAGIASASGLADIGADVFEFEEQLVRLNIQASGQADLDAIRASAKKMRADFGLAMTDSAQAGAALVDKLGGVAASADMIEVLGTRAVGTGADMEDLAGLAQVMDKAFNLKGADNLARGLDRMIAVGKMGSVPLKDMAAVSKQSAAVFTRLGADGAEGVGQLAAALQIAEGAFGTPAEGATGLKAMVEGLEAATIKIPGLRKQLGQVGSEQFIGLDAALDRMATSEFFTDKEKFRKAFPSAPARTMITALVEGRSAFRQLNAASEEGERNAVGYADAQIFAKSSAGQMKIAMGQLRAEVEELFTPERTALMIDALKLLGKVVGFVVDNWKLLLGVLLAVKGAQIGFALLKWARSAKELAGGLGAAQRLLQKLGATPTPAGLVPAGAAPGAGTTAIQKAAGGAIAFGTGFGAGQEIGTGIVGAKEASFERQKRRQRRALSEMERAAEATNILIEAGAVGVDRKIDPELVRSLRVARLTGQELTPLQQAAQTALAGFEVAAPAEVRGGFAGIADTFVEPFRPDRIMRESLVATGPAGATISEGFAAFAEAQKEAIREAVAEIASRPIVVQVGADPIATAVQNAPQNQRSPAP